MRILHVINQLGYGGSEKNLYNIIRSTQGVEHTVAVLQNKGERFNDFQKTYFQPDLTKLAELHDVIHIHRAGWTEDSFLKSFENSNKPIVETNVFARFDGSYLSQKLIKKHLVVSNNSVNTLIQQCGGKVPEWYDVEVVYNNVSNEFFNAKPLFNELSVGRISRADDTKWHDVCLYAAYEAQRLGAKFHVLGMTPMKRSKCSLMGIKAIEYNQTSDVNQLISILEKMCVFIHGSDIGETFGISIAEAMAAGLPVITLSTTYTDNAQAELVSDGVTGFVCGNTTEYKEACNVLLKNIDLAKKMGQLGRERARLLFSEDRIAKKMVRIYKDVGC